MRSLNNDRALVLFSGGQDSTVCLAWALKRFSTVETLGFDYGQRHRVELDCRAAVRAALARPGALGDGRLGEDHVLTLEALGAVSETALTRETEIAMTDAGLPTTFVPGRNLVFLSFAPPPAHRRGRPSFSCLPPPPPPSGGAAAISCSASARPTTPATRTAATTPSRPCR